MPESFSTKLLRHAYNFFPAYRGTGGRITYIASDFCEIKVKIPLNWHTRNYVGTIYGGSMYGAVDPIYMVMLIKTLGSAYDVWDKSAAIQFKKPGRETLYATFALAPDEVSQICNALEREKSIDRSYRIELKDSDGNIYAIVDKVIYISKRDG